MKLQLCATLEHVCTVTNIFVSASQRHSPSNLFDYENNFLITNLLFFGGSSSD